MGVEFDEFDAFLEEELQDPSFAAALEDAEARSRLLHVLVGLRNAQNLKQKAVASAMGTSQSSISELENGGGDYLVSTIQRYARAVDARVTLVVDLPGSCAWSKHPRPHAVDYRDRFEEAPPVKRTSLDRGWAARAAARDRAFDLETA